MMMIPYLAKSACIPFYALSNLFFDIPESSKTMIDIGCITSTSFPMRASCTDGIAKEDLPNDLQIQLVDPQPFLPP